MIGTEMGRAMILRHGGKPAQPDADTGGDWQSLPPKGGINLGMTDGHVEFATLSALRNYYWHLNWNKSAATPPP